MQCTMQTTARNLLSAVIADRLAEQGHVDLPQCVSSPESKPSRLSRVLVRVCRLVRRSGSRFQVLMQQLCFNSRTGRTQFLTFAKELFKNGISHVKIVALYLFSSELANICMENSTELGLHYVHHVMTWHLDYMTTNVTPWLAEKGGWQSFENTLTHDFNWSNRSVWTHPRSAFLAIILLILMVEWM